MLGEDGLLRIVRVLGNGGSATDAMDAVADFRAPHGPGHGRPSLIMYERVDFVAAELLASLQEIEFQDEPEAGHPAL